MSFSSLRTTSGFNSVAKRGAMKERSAASGNHLKVRIIAFSVFYECGCHSIRFTPRCKNGKRETLRVLNAFHFVILLLLALQTVQNGGTHSTGNTYGDSTCDGGVFCTVLFCISGLVRT